VLVPESLKQDWGRRAAGLTTAARERAEALAAANRDAIVGLARFIYERRVLSASELVEALAAVASRCRRCRDERVRPPLSSTTWSARSRVPSAAPSMLSSLVVLQRRRYTRGMKTAVSVPDDLFAQADRLAKRSRRTRSDVYSAALREYVARHAPDEVTAGLDAALAELGEPGPDEFAGQAARRTLETTEW
jgi:predicted transcriptional regulator